MKKLTINTIPLILLLMVLSAAVLNAGWVGISTDNGINYLSADPNEPGPEFISNSVDCPADPNEPGPEFISSSVDCPADPNEPGPEFINSSVDCPADPNEPGPEFT